VLYQRTGRRCPIGAPFDARYRARFCRIEDLSTIGPSRPRSVRETGCDIRTVQKLGHANVKTSELYTDVLNRGAEAVRSPADRLTCITHTPASTNTSRKTRQNPDKKSGFSRNSFVPALPGGNRGALTLCVTSQDAKRPMLGFRRKASE